MTEVRWFEQSAENVPLDDDWLSAREAERLHTLNFPKRRADWRLGRWTAKCALATYLAGECGRHPLASIEILPAPSGAPEAFLENTKAPASLSLSHCGGISACAVAQPDVALGCDLELIEPRSDAFLADYFTPAEQSLVAECCAADRPLLVTLLWSAKESALKMVQTGLRDDTRAVEVSFPMGVKGVRGEHAADLANFLGRPEWQPLHVCYCNREIFHGWWQRNGTLVRTLVANPPPLLPLALDI